MQARLSGLGVPKILFCLPRLRIASVCHSALHGDAWGPNSGPHANTLLTVVETGCQQADLSAAKDDPGLLSFFHLSSAGIKDMCLVLCSTGDRTQGFYV